MPSRRQQQHTAMVEDATSNSSSSKNSSTTDSGSSCCRHRLPCRRRRRRLAIRVGLRVGCLLMLCCLFGVFHLFVPPVQRHFFCDDQSIRYPARSSSVPYHICAPAGVLVALAAIYLTELRRRRQSSVAAANPSPASAGAAAALRASLQAAYFFCLGCAANELATVTGKLALGRHRPYFYEVCRPDLAALSGMGSEGGCNSSVAYPVSLCRPVVSRHAFNDAQMSFPSGHTSFSVYVAAFVAGYLRARLRGVPVARFCLQLGLICCGLYVGYTRVADYKHHWGDVLAGGALGAAAAWAALQAAGIRGDCDAATGVVGHHDDAMGEAAVAASSSSKEAASTGGCCGGEDAVLTSSSSSSSSSSTTTCRLKDECGGFGGVAPADWVSEAAAVKSGLVNGVAAGLASERSID